MEQLNDLLQRARGLRPYGQLYAGVSAAGAPSSIEAVSNAAQKVGLHPVLDRWVALRPDDARQHLRRCLSADLAYSIGSPTPAQEAFVVDLFSYFEGSETEFFSNGRFVNGRLSEWTPFTAATLDTGLALLSSQNGVAVIWVADED